MIRHQQEYRHEKNERREAPQQTRNRQRKVRDPGYCVLIATHCHLKSTQHLRAEAKSQFEDHREQ